eukprot:scaffold49525_cov33-Attheya_sp.AAC.1
MGACSVNPGAIAFAHISIKGDHNFVRPLLAKECQLLKYMPTLIKNDVELVTIAIQECTYAIRYASKSLRENRRFVRSAVRKDWETLMYVSNRMRNDKHIAQIVVQQHSDAIEFCVNKVLREYPVRMNWAIASSKDHLMEDIEVVTAVLREDWRLMRMMEATELQYQPTGSSSSRQWRR